MKLLFVDNSADLQQKWIEPLRAEGWGALRARSAEDADRMLMLHGDSIEVVVVSESLVKWAETHEYPFIVLTKAWAEKDVLAHQNSKRAAFFYQPFSGRVPDLQTAVHSYRSGGPVGGKNENTQWATTKSIALEDFSGVLTKPEITKTNNPEVSIKLEAPSVLFGGESTNADKTIIRLEPVQTAPAASTPEVMEVKLDLGAEVTRISTQAISPPKPEQQQRTADSTIVLESTKLELTNGEEVSEQIDAMAEEQELIGELSINEEIGLKEVVGGLSSSSPQVAHAQTQTYQPAPQVVRIIEGDEALKNYLSLREQDVAVLTGQVRSSQERVHQLELQLKVEKARGTELQHTVQKQEQQIKNFENDKKVEVEVLYRQVEDLNQQLQERSNKAHAIEAKLKVTTDEVNKVKERVRVDIRRIRVREKELESQLEILKKDSSALLQARDEKILELKRKLDLLEFNMELIQEQYHKERQSSEDLRNRLKDAAKAMRQAGGLLEQ